MSDVLATLCVSFVGCIWADKQALIMPWYHVNVQDNINNVSRIIANAKASQNGLLQGLAGTI